MWWTQGMFFMYGNIAAESVEIESPVIAVRCNLEKKIWTELAFE